MLDEQAFDFFRAARGAERQALIRAFSELRTHPAAEGVWQSRDDHGRDVEVGLFGKFLIHYWDDFLAKNCGSCGSPGGNEGLHSASEIPELTPPPPRKR